MKLLCVADTEDPAVYHDRIKDVFPDIDAVLCAGDVHMDYIDFIVSNLNVPTAFVFGNHHTEAARRRTAVDIARLGNANTLDFNDIAHSQHDPTHPGGTIHVRASAGEQLCGAFRAGFINVRLRVAGDTLLVAGAPGCMRYNNGDFQFTEAQMRSHLATLVPGLLYNKARYGRYLDVFLTHAAPAGIHDAPDQCHRGFRCFRTFIDRFEPAYHVHGHIHLYGNDAERSTQVGATTVVNAYDHCILTLNIPDTTTKEATHG
jgi:hypothetical protein